MIMTNISAAFITCSCAGWIPHGRGASRALVVDSRESKYPPVVEISWG